MRKNGKFITVILCLMLLVVLVRIGFWKTAGNDTGKDTKVNFVEFNKGNVISRLDTDGGVMAETVYRSEEEYIKEAEFIVKGKIKEIQYCEYLGTPWRRLRVQVLDAIAGDVKEGEEIVVYLIGGYLSSKEYYSYFLDQEVPKGKESDLYEIEMRPEESLMEEKDTEIFLLERASKESPFESTAYESVGGYDAEYLYDKNLGQYKQYQNNGEEKHWKENKLYEKLKK